MSKGAKLRGHGTIVRISQQYNQPWRGFTLQCGHLFGQDEQGYFVSAAMPERNNRTIIVYRCDTSTGDYLWRKTCESVTTATVCKILEAAKNSGHKIVFEPVSKQVARIYPQRPTSGVVYR